MINKLGMNFKNSQKSINELKNRIIFVIISLIIFRIGSFIPIPGIDTTILSRILDNQKGTIFEMFNMFSGGALNRASIFALGIMPYISASIVIQLLTLVVPFLSELKKEGESGRHKINQYTRYATLVLAFFQSVGAITSLSSISSIRPIIIDPDFYFYCTAIIILVTGTMFLMWLGELITECGIGNGISIIIFTGIIAGLPSAIINTIEQTRQGHLHLLLFLSVLVLIFLVVFVIKTL